MKTEIRERPAIFSAPMVRAILAGTKTQTRRVVKLIEGGDVPPPPFPNGRPFDRLGPCVYNGGKLCWETELGTCTCTPVASACPYGVAGDRLWVRETWADTNGESGPMISYRAGGDRFLVDESYPVDYSRYPGCTFAMWGGDLRRGESGHAWRSPIHMPRWASRLTLEVTGVRVERVQAISEADAISEGVETHAQKYGLSEQKLHGTTPWYRYDGAACAAVSAAHSFRTLWDSIHGPESWAANPFVWVVSFKRVEVTNG